MSFSFNQAGYNYANITGSEAIQPENTGIGWIAQQRLNNLTGRANQKLINALKVDGVPLVIWPKTQTGYPCTCCRPDGSTAGLLSAVVENVSSTNSFYTDPSSTTLPDPTDNTYKVLRLKSTNLIDDISNPIWSSVINPIDNKVTPEVPENLQLNSVQVDLNQNEDLDLFSPNANEQEGQQAFGDIELDAFFAGGDSGAMFGGDKTACGICFTSGWTQGYSLLNGKRILLDNSGETAIYSLGGATIDTTAFPNAFSLPMNGLGVIWGPIELPVFCQQWVNIRARNNLKPAPGIIIQYCINDGNFNWQNLTLDILNTTSNSATRIWYFRAVRDPTYQQLPSVSFTHIELMVITSDPVPSQTPNFSYNTDFNQYDAIVNTTFDIAPTISMLPRESVFSDNKYGLFWKVIDVTPQMTAGQQIFGYSVNARLIQRHEQLYKLHELYVDVPNYLSVSGASGTQLSAYNSTTVNPLNEIASTTSNYQRLDQVQGQYPVINELEQNDGIQVDNIELDDAQPILITTKQIVIPEIPLQQNTGLTLTEGQTGTIQYETFVPTPIVIKLYYKNVFQNVAFAASGTYYPCTATSVNVGYSLSVTTQPSTWTAATLAYPNWTISYSIPITSQFVYLWARVISPYQTKYRVVGPINVLPNAVQAAAAYPTLF